MSFSVGKILFFCLGLVLFGDKISAMQQPSPIGAGETLFQLYLNATEDGLSDAIAQKLAIEKYVNLCGQPIQFEADPSVKLAYWKSELVKVDLAVVSQKHNSLAIFRITRMLGGVQARIWRICGELQAMSDPGFLRRWVGRLGQAGSSVASKLSPLSYLPMSSGQKPKEKKD